MGRLVARMIDMGLVVGNGLQAAALLARGRRDGLDLIAAGPETAWTNAARSFWAMLLALPAVVALHVLDWVPGGVPPHPTRGFALDLLSFGIGWAGFAVISHRILVRTGKAAVWPRFITAYNWCNVVQYLLLLAGSLPAVLGAPEVVSETAWLVTMGWALWLEWFAFKHVLPVSGPRAAALVLLDFALGLTCATTAAALI